MLGLLRGLSPEDLQDPECDLPAGEGTMTSSPFSSACPDHLIVATPPPPPVVSFPIPLADTERQEPAALRIVCIKELKTIGVTEVRPQSRREERCLVLLARLSELQEVEDHEVLSALRDEVRSGSRFRLSSSTWGIVSLSA